MDIQFTINRFDLLRFNLHHAAHRRLTWAIVGICAALIASTVPNDMPVTARLIIFVFILPIMTVVYFLATAAIALLSYAPAKNRGVFGRHDLSITSEDISEFSQVNSSKWSWASVPKVSQNGSYIYIYVQQNLAHIVPKRAFHTPEEAREFYGAARSAWLASKGAA